jgi:Ca-activated chloride channel family protein
MLLAGLTLFSLTIVSTLTWAQNAATPQAQPATPTPPAAPPQQNNPPGGQTQNQSQGQSQAQMPVGDDNGVFVFKTAAEEVVLHATVIDNKDRIILDLGRDAFSVFENDKPQAISSFRREDVPVAMGIVIDNSGSMREKRDKVNKAALSIWSWPAMLRTRSSWLTSTMSITSTRTLPATCACSKPRLKK